jgi:outer membrane cobalamin receptor
VLLVSATFAGTITGKVTGKETGDALLGANVYLQGMPVGAATDEGGIYSFDVKDGSYVLVCDYVGYAKQTISVDVSGTVTFDFELVEFLFAKTISVVADRARDRETPVAYSTVRKERMTHTLASQDIPMVLNTTPSVYATMQGGGAGDARINVRGFDQRNVAVMINGMPMNDMENGWVYWSNWDGVGDATSSIQMQRGLSAANLATPAIGGSMNIITDPTAHDRSLLLRQEFGTGSFLKTTFTGHSGLIDDKWAVSATVVKKTGDGIVDATWTDAWAWYLGAAYNINENHRLELYGLGAPQRHGQNLYKQNITTYSKEFAKDVGYTADELEAFEELGRKYNQNWGPVSSSYF